MTYNGWYTIKPNQPNKQIRNIQRFHNCGLTAIGSVVLQLLSKDGFGIK